MTFGTLHSMCDHYLFPEISSQTKLRCPFNNYSPRSFPLVTSGILYPSFCLLEFDLFKLLHVNKMPSIYSTVLIRYRTPSLQPLDYQTSQISCKRPVVIHYSQWSSHWKTYCLHTICWVHGKPASQPFLSFTSYLRKQASFRWYHAVRQQQARNSLRSSKYLAVLLFLQLCQRNAIHLPASQCHRAVL